eukprot:scaffold81643_cov41-Phaeocystis_antarctica.AAC.4
MRARSRERVGAREVLESGERGVRRVRRRSAGVCGGNGGIQTQHGVFKFGRMSHLPPKPGQARLSPRPSPTKRNMSRLPPQTHQNGASWSADGTRSGGRPNSARLSRTEPD